jgi:translation initiation factor 2B subunit (eIF-2B alpha/beta/delta family)
VEKKQIIVHLKYPTIYNNSKLPMTESIKRSLEKIHDDIVQDLTDELETVKEPLFYGDITYFLEVKKEIAEVKLDEQLERDIINITYYSLLDNPSSSALSSLVLQATYGIIDSHQPSNTESGQKKSVTLIRKEVKSFLEEIDENVLSSRQCHTGLKSLVSVIRRIAKSSKSATNLKSTIKNMIDELETKRNSLRRSAECYFYHNQVQFLKINMDKPCKPYNILLYGYSELVLKALCGFREAVLTKLLDHYTLKKTASMEMSMKHTCSQSGLNQTYHNTNLEKLASNYFRIFICEGQPKNKTAWGGRIVYHDGISYALSFKEHGFHNVNIIPDAITGSLINPHSFRKNYPSIDFVMVGANGFDNSKFLHSAGHSMVVSLTSYAKYVYDNDSAIKKEKVNKPSLVLAVITDKYVQNAQEAKIKNQEESIVRDGWVFGGSISGEPIRDSIFISQDPKVKAALHGEEESIFFYNPREDLIPIKCVDVVITEKAWLDKNLEEEWNGSYIEKKEKDSAVK